MKKRCKRCPRGAQADAMRLWAEIEEHFVPNLRVWLGERVVYFYLVRRTRLAGKRRLETSIGQLAHELCLSKTATRTAVRRLAGVGALRIVGRSHVGHKIEVKTPREIAGCMKKAERSRGWNSPLETCGRSRSGRIAIFQREGHRCFYCLRLLDTRARAVDHVVPRARGGRDDYRNVVASCAACNFLKKDMAAEDFVRRLHRQSLISRREFYRRIAALRALKQGRLRPGVEQSKLVQNR